MYVIALFQISKSCLLLVDFLRASRGIVYKKTLVESEETNPDYRASGNRVMRIRVTRGLGVLHFLY